MSKGSPDFSVDDDVSLALTGTDEFIVLKSNRRASPLRLLDYSYYNYNSSSPIANCKLQPQKSSINITSSFHTSTTIPAWVKPDLTRLLSVEKNPGSFASRAISLITLPAGSVFARITNPTPATVAYSSVQAGRDLHIELNCDLVYINHSCKPSLVFDMHKWEVRVSGERDLKEGDELTFFYPSTEWDMVQPFECLCGSKECRGRITGAKDMDEGVLGEYWLNPHIEELLEERGGVMIPAWVKPDLSRLLCVEKNPGSFASRAISLITLPAGSVFARITNPTPATVAYSSVQAGRDLHIELNCDLVYINHSCKPSLVFDMHKWEVRVSGERDLKEGDELTFFYPSTEWDMVQPFECLCGSKECRGRITGAKDMDEGVLGEYWLNPHIEELLEEKGGMLCGEQDLMKICVLQPDFSTLTVDNRHSDPPRSLASSLSRLGHVHHEALHELTVHRQLTRLAGEGFDIFVNLCDGHLNWDVPSIEVIQALERLGLPATGPSVLLHDPSKPLMKYVAYAAGVATPRHVVVMPREDACAAVLRAGLNYPLFVTPAHLGYGLGAIDRARVVDPAALQAQVVKMQARCGQLLIEEYVAGRDFTVLVLGDIVGEGRGTALEPVEYQCPADCEYKSYALNTCSKVLHMRVEDPAVRTSVMHAAEAVFRGFDGTGYARMDFRMDAAGTLYFLEVNFSCSVELVDHILALDGIVQAGFLMRIIAEGQARHARKQKSYLVRGDSIAGYGIVAARDLSAGAIVFHGEGRAQRIVTRRHVETTWGAEDRVMFDRYAYPLSDEVFVLWDRDPSEWAPQNHSCDPNTSFDGLDVVAIRAIHAGEELTLDYAQFLDASAEAFECQCGASICRGQVTGVVGNSVTVREHVACALQTSDQ